MSYYIIFPTLAFIINTFVWSYVLGQRQQDPVSRSFLLLATAVGGWLIGDFLMLSSLSFGWEMTLIKVQSVFWIPTGYLFMNFAYALAGKKRDVFTIVGAIASVVGIIFYVFTDWIAAGYETYPWGIALDTKSTPFLMYTLGNILFGTYSLCVIYRSRDGERDPATGRTVNLILFGSGAAVLSVSVLNVVIPDVLEIKSVPRFGSSTLVIFIFIVFVAVSKYRFLAISTDKVAEELFEEIDDGIVIINRFGAIQRTNDKAFRLLGDPESRRRLEQVFSEGVGKKTLHLDGGPEGEGNERILSVSVSNASHENETVGRIAILRDITEQKRAEDVLRSSRDALENEVEKRVQELRHAQKMEAIGTLAGGIAHDFNNILAAISGFTHAALQGLPPVHPIRSDLNEVIIASGRAREIVQQILTFSRPKDRSDFRSTQVRETVDEALELLRVALPASIRIETSLNDVSGAMRCNPTQISQVLMNLGTNAFQAMKETEGAMLTIGVDRLRITPDGEGVPKELGEGEYVSIAFRDNGTGMSDEVRRCIFDPFFTTKKQGEGTGLGLSTALEIVRNHDGTISVESAVGEGTCFSVFLPVFDAASEDEAPLEVEVKGGDERIMFVDDEAQLRRVARRILDPLGYRVTTCANGQEAIECFKSNADGFDLVVTDQTMPKVTGLELAEQLLALRPTLPIILLSGYGAAVSEAAVARAGIRFFMKKPMPENLLPLKIRELLDAQAE